MKLLIRKCSMPYGLWLVIMTTWKTEKQQNIYMRRTSFFHVLILGKNRIIIGNTLCSFMFKVVTQRPKKDFFLTKEKQIIAQNSLFSEHLDSSKIEGFLLAESFANTTGLTHWNECKKFIHVNFLLAFQLIIFLF